MQQATGCRCWQCRPSGCTMVSGVVGGGVCNCSQMRTSKCTCLIFGVSIGLGAGLKRTEGIFNLLRKRQESFELLGSHTVSVRAFCFELSVAASVVCLSTP